MSAGVTRQGPVHYGDVISLYISDGAYAGFLSSLGYARPCFP